MWSNDQRIQFIVRFARENLDHYRPGDWLNCREDLKSFLGYDGLVGDAARMGFFKPNAAPLPHDMTEDNIRALQADVRTAIDFFVSPSGKATGASVRVGTPLTVTLSYFGAKIPGMGGFIQREGSTRDCMLGLMFRLLEEGETSPVVRCPECESIFYRRGKQVFCTRQCTNRAMVKRKRAGKSKPRKIARKRGRKSATARRSK